MPFKTKSFDYCIEKGTIDALMCGDDIEIPKKILDEIDWVTKKNIFFITHKEPIGRISLLKNLDRKIFYAQ